MKQALQEYSEARIRLRKSLQKMTYRVNQLKDDLLKRKFNCLKKEVYMPLRRMDNYFRKVIGEKEPKNRKVYK